jgi:CPA1 family monovalent cation:H+ antiporter
MAEGALVTPIFCVVSLLLVASASAIVLRRIGFPYTIGLVVIGILLGALAGHIDALEPVRRMHLTPDIILYIIVPTLVFEASVNIDSRLLVDNLIPVLGLAAPGLILATVITGILVTYLTPLPLGPAMLFGTLISATDPVAVIALFKELGAPKRLTLLVDGESLFNDATAIVLFNIVFAIVASGEWGLVTFLSGAFSFVSVFLGGFIIGAIIGYFMIRMVALADNDPLIEVAFSTVFAYAAFIIANYYLKVSGIMSVVGAGVVISWFGYTRFTPEAKQYLRQFWEYAAFVANSFIFLLIGLTEDYLFQDIIRKEGLIRYILVAVMAVTLARVAVVFGLVPMTNRLPGASPIGRGYRTVMFWGGLRGAVPLALCLSLPVDFSHRSLIIELTLGVVLFTLLIQGTTVRRLIDLFKLDEETVDEKAARFQAVIASKKEGLRRVSLLKTDGVFPDQLTQTIAEEYKKEVTEAGRTLERLRSAPGFETETKRFQLWLQALTIERRAYHSLFEQGFITEGVLRRIESHVEFRKERLRNGEIPPPRKVARLPEKRLLTRLLHVVSPLLPGYHLAPRYLANTLAAEYEKETAMAEASIRVESALDRLAELSGAAVQDVELCRKFYEDRRQIAIHRLKSLSTQFPEYAGAIQARSIRRAALDGERTVIQELADNGGLAEKAAASLKKEIQGRLREYSDD